MAQVVVVKNAFDVFEEVNGDDIEDFVEKETKKNSKLVEEENKPIIYNKSKLDDEFNNHKNKSRNRRKNKNINSAYGSSHNSLDSDPNQGRAPRDQGNGYRSNDSGPKQFTNVNNGGRKFFKDFTSRDPSHVSDGRDTRGGHDDGRVNRGGHSDGSRGYHGGGNGGGRGYHGGYNGDERGYHGGGNGGGRGYHGGGNGDVRGYRGGGNGGGRGYNGGGYGGGRGNHGGNGGGGMAEDQKVDRNGEVVNKTVYVSNQSVNGGSAKDNSSTDSQPPLSEAELERREKLRQEMERDAQLMTLAQYEKVLEDKKKELQEKLSSNGGDNKVEKPQPKTNVKQAGFTLQNNSYQRDDKNTSQKKILHEMRNMVYLSLQPTRYRPRRWEQNEQGSSVILDKDKSTSSRNGNQYSDKNSDDTLTEDAEVPDMNEFPVLCSNASKRV